MFIRNIAIITAGIFHEELLVLVVLGTAKFNHSVSSVFWCLFIGPPSSLPDMAGEPTVFQKVDRSVKQMKFHLKSYLILDRKTDINPNNLPKSKVRNLCFETLSMN